MRARAVVSFVFTGQWSPAVIEGAGGKTSGKHGELSTVNGAARTNEGAVLHAVAVGRDAHGYVMVALAFCLVRKQASNLTTGDTSQ